MRARSVVSIIGAWRCAGSWASGTVVAAATLGLRCLEGIRRPGIGVLIHGEHNPFLVIDVGANPQPKAHHLAQYALMGSAYYQGTFGEASPKVGILNIGSEEQKGNPLVREARAMMRQLPINFHGNVEGVEIFSGACHVVVTDGFTGKRKAGTAIGTQAILKNEAGHSTGNFIEAT